MMLLQDNTTAHNATEYDCAIQATIPYYTHFHDTALSLVQASGIPVHRWLDTGCGTGSFTRRAHKAFPNASFTLADPAHPMLQQAKEKAAGAPCFNFIQAGTQALAFDDNSFDVITAIQCHHYLEEANRRSAIKNCYRMLSPGGLLIVFENIRPFTPAGENIGLSRWKAYQMQHGKTEAAARKHIARYGKEYFPITIAQHLELLQQTGFAAVEIAWVSYMQAGFYAVK